MNASRRPLDKTSLTSANKTSMDEGKPFLGELLYVYMNNGSEPVKSRKDDTTVSELEQIQTVKLVPKELNSSQPLDADSKRSSQYSPGYTGTRDDGLAWRYNLKSEEPYLGGSRDDDVARRSGPYDPLAPRPGGLRPDPLAFAPRPYRPYPPHKSSGWLNE
ncbi:hypothetical protein LguiA_010363 [Lonicera macranthoides]